MTDETPKIEPRENGPLMVRNLALLTGSEGHALETKPVMAPVCSMPRCSPASIFPQP